MRPLSPAALYRVATTLRSLFRARRGNVMMILGFALIPMTYAAGMAIDYSRAARLQTKLNAAADAGALSGTTKPMMQQSLLAACNTARKTFLNATQQGASGLRFNASDLSISITERYAGAADVTVTCPNADATLPVNFSLPTTRTVTVNWQGLSSNAFSGILGSPTIAIGGTSTARSTQASYYQVVFLVDVSSSMGIGGTPADIDKLNSDPTIKCAFACHDPNSTGSSPSASNYCNSNPSNPQCHANANYCPPKTRCSTVSPSPTYSDKRALAQIYGYKLKVDYVNEAMSQFIDALQARVGTGSDYFAVSIYTFGTGFNTVQAPTTDIAAVKGKRIDLEIAARSPPGYPNQGWTYASTGLRSMRSALPNVGDGSSATARQTYVVFISDGVENVFDRNDPLRQWNRVTNYNYVQECSAAKNAGMTVFSIETAYANIPNDDQYNVLVRDLPTRNNGKQIADAMRECASGPQRYFMATDGNGIATAADSVFTMIASEVSHLTQ